MHCIAMLTSATISIQNCNSCSKINATEGNSCNKYTNKRNNQTNNAAQVPRKRDNISWKPFVNVIFLHAPKQLHIALQQFHSIKCAAHLQHKQRQHTSQGAHAIAIFSYASSSSLHPVGRLVARSRDVQGRAFFSGAGQG